MGEKYNNMKKIKLMTTIGTVAGIGAIVGVAAPLSLTACGTKPADPSISAAIVQSKTLMVDETSTVTIAVSAHTGADLTKLAKPVDAHFIFGD
jgi:hypothetical protein